MARFEVNYSSSANGWDVTIYWDAEFDDSYADVYWKVNQNSYSRTFAIVVAGNSSNKLTSGSTIAIGTECYFQVFRYGSYSQQEGPFYITRPDPPTYTITYDANGGSGAPSAQTKNHNVSVVLSSAKPTKGSVSAGSYTITLDANEGSCSVGSLSAQRTTTYTFSTWNTNYNGNGTSYSPGETYYGNYDLYLYAIYTSSTSTATVELPTPTRNGYEFLGWAESASAGSGVTGSYRPEKTLTLYAIWKAKGLVHIYDGSGFSTYQVFIYDGSSWELYSPYVFDGSSWSMCV